MSKVLTLDRAVELCREMRGQGRTIAQCHGCFDLVHPGHVRHLKQAAEQADLLLVSITTDASVDKGDGRPLFSEHLRAENLAALSFVDIVCVNTAPTAEELLERVRPDVYVKGREYETNDDPRFASERRAVERHGGRVMFTSGDLVFSSTALISEIASREGRVAEDPRSVALRRLRSVHDLSVSALEGIIVGMRGAKTLVVGETIIDTYISCDRPEIASESPCMSLRPLEQVSFDGGAAVIALHAASFGAETTLVTALPSDVHAAAFIERMERAGIHVCAIPCEGPMLEKQRFLVGHDKVVKLDRVRPLALDAEAREQLLDTAKGESSGGVDASLVADFGNGLLTPRSLQEVSEALRPMSRILAGDVSGRRSSLTSLREMDLITPTEMELREAVHDYESSLNAVVWELMERIGARAIITTMADDGLIAFERLAGALGAGWRARVAGEHIPGLESRPLDPLGCGDALLATATLSLACGATQMQAAFLGAVAAAGESSRLGNHALGAETLVQLMHSLVADQPTLRAVSVRGSTPAIGTA